MGDTGSLFVGLIIAILVVKFNEFNATGAGSYVLNSAPVISFAVVIVPLIDVLRVIVIRLLNGHSPFRADRNHIHHRLLELVPKHLTVTLITNYHGKQLCVFQLYVAPVKINFLFPSHV